MRLERPGPAWPRILAGQKALVTGANSGIGKAVAIKADVSNEAEVQAM